MNGSQNSSSQSIRCFKVSFAVTDHFSIMKMDLFKPGPLAALESLDEKEAILVGSKSGTSEHVSVCRPEPVSSKFIGGPGGLLFGI
jgi:hypothetical protein